MSSAFTYGSRVRITPTDLDSWASEALKAFTGVFGTIIEVKENPFEANCPCYLVEFDKPIKKWSFLSTTDPETNPCNFYRQFHFLGCDLSSIAPEAALVAKEEWRPWCPHCGRLGLGNQSTGFWCPECCSAIPGPSEGEAK